MFFYFQLSSTGAHCGRQKPRDDISSRFYWPGMIKNINSLLMFVIPPTKNPKDWNLHRDMTMFEVRTKKNKQTTNHQQTVHS